MWKPSNIVKSIPLSRTCSSAVCNIRANIKLPLIKDTSDTVIYDLSLPLTYAEQENQSKYEFGKATFSNQKIFTSCNLITA